MDTIQFCNEIYRNPYLLYSCVLNQPIYQIQYVQMNNTRHNRNLLCYQGKRYKI